ISQMLAQYPHFADRIKANRNSPSWFGSFGTRLKRALRGGPRHLIDIIQDRGEDAMPSGPTCDKYTVYILDGTINRSAKPVDMGKAGTMWNYRVPHLGQVIPTNGMMEKTKEAMEDDCLLYPLRRKLVCTDD